MCASPPWRSPGGLGVVAGVEGSGGGGCQLAGGPGGPAHVQALQGGGWQGGRNSPVEFKRPEKWD